MEATSFASNAFARRYDAHRYKARLYHRRMSDKQQQLSSQDVADLTVKNDSGHENDPENTKASIVPPFDRPRMWAPWRMRYVGGERRSSCVFCDHAQSTDDANSLVLYRTELAYIVMNLFPYSGGHVMVVPVTHTDSPEHVDDATLVEISRQTPPAMRALRRALRCDGFNVGYNIGAAAGAGIADHLHQHIVPRWVGDSNFMPVLSGTHVLPELIPATYGKLRAEIEREFRTDSTADQSITLVLLDPIAQSVAVHAETDGRLCLPTVQSDPQKPVWQAAASAARRGLTDAIFLGWAGQARAGAPFGRTALALIGTALTPDAPKKADHSENWTSVPWAEARAEFTPEDQASLDAALVLL